MTRYIITYATSGDTYSAEHLTRRCSTEGLAVAISRLQRNSNVIISVRLEQD